MTGANLMLLRHIVELNPRTVRAVHNALGTENGAVLAGIQRGEDAVDIRLRIHLGCFLTPGGEHLIGVVMMVMVMAGAVGVIALVMVMMMLVFMLMAAALVMVMVMLEVMLVLMVMVMMVMFMLMLLVLMVMVDVYKRQDLSARIGLITFRDGVAVGP